MNQGTSNRIAIVAIIVAISALGYSVYSSSLGRVSVPSSGSEPTSTFLSRLDKSNVIRAGYGVYPPFTQEDVKTGKISGVSVEIVEEIARVLGAKVEWHRFNWNTMGADLKRGEFDVVADPIFLTPQRAREFAFTQPYSYFGIGIGLVKKGETRFKSFDDINDPAVTVAVGQGFGEESLVKSRAPKAKLLSIPAGQDTAAPLNSVLAGHADIAITNLEDGHRFVDAHPDNLQLLWTDAPPAYIPAGFALRLNDSAGVRFFDVSLLNLKGAGILGAIAARYNSTVNMAAPAGR
jgi:polar amino acid transport system substrate-binding protein